MNIPRKMIEAGARALYDAEPNYEDDPVCHWEKLGPGTHKRYADQAEAAIRAAIGCAEVVRTNEHDDCDVSYAEVDCDWRVIEGTQVDLHPGDTILIVRAEKGGGNGAG